MDGRDGSVSRKIVVGVRIIGINHMLETVQDVTVLKSHNNDRPERKAFS